MLRGTIGNALRFLRVAAPSIRIVPWMARASCWPLPQQLLPASATGRGRRCCRSHPVGMSTVVAAAALRKGVFNLTHTGIEQGGGAQHRNQSPGGALVSPRVPTVRNVYRGRSCFNPYGNCSGADRRQRAKTSPGRGKMSHSDKKGSTGKRSWGRGQRDANAAPRREAYAGNHDPRQGSGAPLS